MTPKMGSARPQGGFVMTPVHHQGMCGHSCWHRDGQRGVVYHDCPPRVSRPEALFSGRVPSAVGDCRRNSPALLATVSGELNALTVANSGAGQLKGFATSKLSKRVQQPVKLSQPCLTVPVGTVNGK
jgi:hypothetical protein